MNNGDPTSGSTGTGFDYLTIQLKLLFGIRCMQYDVWKN